MPTQSIATLSHKASAKIIAAIKQHYRNRGVPESRLDEMRYRWIREKGWRVPNAA